MSSPSHLKTPADVVERFNALPLHDVRVLAMSISDAAVGGATTVTLLLDEFFGDDLRSSSRAQLTFHGCRGLKLNVDFASKRALNDWISGARARTVLPEDLKWLDLTIPVEDEEDTELVAFEIDLAETAVHEFIVLAHSFSVQLEA